jgi:hypothetical protein
MPAIHGAAPDDQLAHHVVVQRPQYSLQDQVLAGLENVT